MDIQMQYVSRMCYLTACLPSNLSNSGTVTKKIDLIHRSTGSFDAPQAATAPAVVLGAGAGCARFGKRLHAHGAGVHQDAASLGFFRRTSTVTCGVVPQMETPMSVIVGYVCISYSALTQVGKKRMDLRKCGIFI